MTNPETAALLTAERQHGLITRRQAAELGITRARWRQWATRGGWELVTNRVARRLGSPRTTHQRVLAAALDVGPSTYVSHWSAAALWGIPNVDVEPTDLIVVRGGSQTRTALARTHRPRHLPDPFSTVLDGIPVVRPALVVLQLASMVSPARLGRLLDQFWTRRLLSGPSMARELAPLMHRGRAGTVAVRQLLESLPPGYVPPATGLEGRFASILERAGLEPMRRQVDLGDDASWSGRVDFLDADLPFVVEVDSERYHAALTDAAADRARQERLEAGGFVVRRFDEVDVWRHPERIVDEVRAVRAELRRQTRPITASPARNRPRGEPSGAVRPAAARWVEFWSA